MHFVLRFLAILLFSASGLILAHDENHGAAVSANAGDETAFGRPGISQQVSRTVEVTMSDTMRFAPNAIHVKRGATIRIRVRNDGKTEHELVIGKLKELQEHAALMRRYPNMHHADANMVNVAPGQTKELVWQFTRAGRFHYGCLEPGHFEAGMRGRINVMR